MTVDVFAERPSLGKERSRCGDPAQTQRAVAGEIFSRQGEVLVARALFPGPGRTMTVLPHFPPDQRVGLGGAGTHLPRSPDGATAQGAPAKGPHLG